MFVRVGTVHMSVRAALTFYNETEFTSRFDIKVVLDLPCDPITNAHYVLQKLELPDSETGWCRN